MRIPASNASASQQDIEIDIEIDDEDAEEPPRTEPNVDTDPELEVELHPSVQETTKKKKDPKKEAGRDPGKTLFPFTRVQKIIKADKDIPIIAKDATFLISLATEEFIKRICEASQKIAERERRMTVQQKDLVTLVRKADEFAFLAEIIQHGPTQMPPTAKRKPKAMEATTETGRLDHFVVTKKGGEDIEDTVVTKDDGTMSIEETQ